jgi:hypothetical protein
MSWERDPLWAKAKLFFERAFDESDDDSLFGLWCALGLDLLGRAALASISPTLLAAPDNNHRNLLYALNYGSQGKSAISITATQVFALCPILVPSFTTDEQKTAMALINRRNDELHSGLAAFQEYRPTQWLAGFYRTCKILLDAMGESLETLFGVENAKIAEGILADSEEDVRQRVSSQIAAHARVFQEKEITEQEAAKSEAKEKVSKLVSQRHHRVTCPACQSDATVQGIPFGKENITSNETEIIGRQSISPTNFSCPSCGLNLKGYAELEAANLGGRYTRRTTYSPGEYYGLINPDDIGEYVEKYLAENAGEEYDNE